MARMPYARFSANRYSLAMAVRSVRADGATMLRRWLNGEDIISESMAGDVVNY